ncbi:MAG: hypothetical protein ABH814_02350 [bacterium]
MKNSQTAILDINTNQIKLYIYETSGAKPTLISSKSIFVDLSKDLKPKIMLGKEALNKGVETILKLYQEAASQNISNIQIVSTGLACLAENHDEMATKLSQKLGKKIAICAEDKAATVLLDSAIESALRVEEKSSDKPPL